ncbi:hypothetical protein BV22DRAFT_1051261 [Leucogyrophana mollusca]|uniref:Uncharacterized protein n=1 Tax=Leucogyrophana mollusca TaxID=85980 RepID=A0ACB8B0C1_9AGAM|nr:hypothetical protein BV22DRAFT_1051261 [Leucogyrophana mollusca]
MLLIAAHPQCHGCGRHSVLKQLSRPMNLCRGCGCQIYCCANAQRGHWKVHKPVCKDTERNSPSLRLPLPDVDQPSHALHQFILRYLDFFIPLGWYITKRGSRHLDEPRERIICVITLYYIPSAFNHHYEHCGLSKVGARIDDGDATNGDDVRLMFVLTGNDDDGILADRMIVTPYEEEYDAVRDGDLHRACETFNDDIYYDLYEATTSRRLVCNQSVALLERAHVALKVDVAGSAGIDVFAYGNLATLSLTAQFKPSFALTTTFMINIPL